MSLIRQRRAALALILSCACIGAAIGYLQQAKQQSHYESTATILIREAESSGADVAVDIPKTDGATAFQDVLTSPSILQQAVHRGNLGPLRCLRNAPDAAVEVRKRLAIAPLSPQAPAFVLRFTAEHPGEPTQVLRALVDVYQELLGAKSQQNYDEALRLFREARTSLLEQIRGKEKSLAAIRESAPAEWLNPTYLDERRREFDELLARQENLSRITNQLKARSEAVNDALATGDAVDLAAIEALPQASVTGATTNKPSASAAQSSTALRDLLVEEAQLLQQYGDNHPKVKLIRARIAALPAGAAGETEMTRLKAEEKLLLEDHGANHPKVLALRAKLYALENIAAAESGKAGNADVNTAPPAVAARFAPAASTDLSTKLRQELASLETQAESLNAAVVAKRAALNNLEAWNLQARQLEDEIRRIQALYEIAVGKLQSQSGDRAAVEPTLVLLSPPTPGRLVESQVWRSPVYGAAIGGLLGLALSLLKARSSLPTINHGAAPRDAVPILGRLPALSSHVAGPNDASVHPLIVAYHAPQSAAAEAYRALRAIVAFRAAQASSRCIALVSCGADDLVPLVAANLATSFSLAGKRTLLIAPAAGPLRLDKLLHVAPSAHLDEALDGRAEPSDALVATPIEDLYAAAWSGARDQMEIDGGGSAWKAMCEKFEITLVVANCGASDHFPLPLAVDGLIWVTRSGADIPTEVQKQATESRHVLGAIVVGTSNAPLTSTILSR